MSRNAMSELKKVLRRGVGVTSSHLSPVIMIESSETVAGMRPKIIRYRQRAALEKKVEQMSKEGWITKWETYQETHEGRLLEHKTWYSVVMEKPEKKSKHRLPF